jgi:hypothetical protein
VFAHADADAAAGDCTKSETAPGLSQAVRANRPPSDRAFFQGAKETLDAPIHPGAARFGYLVFDIEQPQYDLKPLSLEERFIVGADDSGFAIAVDHTNELLQQGQDRFVLQGSQGQIRSAGVFHDAQQTTGVTITISLSG